ncbi:hypothetical protein DWV00_11910 [Trinickia dinghuensis]|uniref:Uncharacterized protein n=1 Tax=Trinickia dinghuensis TaxID=2291023 RepID=A0A3D8K1F0_9BURK|nr:hypothetical protein DWV00_11910 [Trinickia dinghuensis]
MLKHIVALSSAKYHNAIALEISAFLLAKRCASTSKAILASGVETQLTGAGSERIQSLPA